MRQFSWWLRESPVREEESEPVRTDGVVASRRKEEAVNPEQHRHVGTGLWLHGPTSTASCENAGKSDAEIVETGGRYDMDAVAVTCVVARGPVDASEALPQACLVGAALRAALR